MIRGGLFTRYFLDDDIRETDEYRALDPIAITDFSALDDAINRPILDVADVGAPLKLGSGSLE